MSLLVITEPKDYIGYGTCNEKRPAIINCRPSLNRTTYVGYQNLYLNPRVTAVSL